MSRLNWLTVQPKLILDAGGGSGRFSQRLQERYPQAQVVLVDLAPGMVQHAKNQYPQLACIQADAAALPFPACSVDLIFANLILPWQDNCLALFKEWRRVLSPNGVLLFTAFGPDTLRAWQDKIPQTMHLYYHDLHDLGDQLMQVGLVDPVLDVSFYTLHYREADRFCFELEKSGMGKPLFSAECDSIPLQATYEVIYGHAFGSDQEPPSQQSSGTVVPLAQFRRQVKQNKPGESH